MCLFPLREGNSQTLADTARALAGRVTAALAPGEPVQLSFRNLSGKDEAEVRAAWQLIDTALRARAEGPAPATVAITFSQSAEGYLWVAELTRAGRREQVMIERAGEPAPTERRLTTIGLQKTLLWEQDEPILDIAATGSELVVLSAAGAAFYARQGDAWTPRKTIPISPTKAWPRDLRGRVLVGGDSVRVFLPGLHCSGDLRPEPSLACKQGDEPWPGAPPGAAIPAGRNYFSAEGMQPFFSAAPVGDRWILATTKGRIETLRGATIELDEWSDEIATVESPCGEYVLAAGAGEPLMVHALAISDGAASALGDSLLLPGRLTALWQASAKDSAVAISKDVDTGRYAAFNLSVTCGR